MLTELYVEALLADEDLADQVWELWNDRLIPDDLTSVAWLLIAETLVARYTLRFAILTAWYHSLYPEKEKKKGMRHIRIIGLTAALVLLNACGGGSSSGGNNNQPPPPPVTVTISGIATDDPLDDAAVELMRLDFTVTASTTTDASGAFSFTVNEADANAGYRLRVSGGQTAGVNFVGELSAIYAGDHPPNQANVTPLTTIISRITDRREASDLIGERDDVISSLTGIGAFPVGVWSDVTPQDVEFDRMREAFVANGFEETVISLVDDLQDADISKENVIFFPRAHGGIVLFSINDSNVLSAFSGTAGSQKTSKLVFDPAAQISFAASGNPSWISIDASGELFYDVPSGETPGSQITFSLTATNSVTGFGRAIQARMDVLEELPIAEKVIDERGGNVQDEKWQILVEVPEGAATSPTSVSIRRARNADGVVIVKIEADAELSSPFTVHLPQPEVLASSILGSTQTPVASSKSGVVREESTIAGNDTCSTNDRPDVDPLEYPVTHIWQATCAYFIDVRLRSLTRLPIASLTVASNRSLDLQIKEASWLFSTVPKGHADLKISEPVLFIHGFTPQGSTPGGRGTWGEFPAMFILESRPYTPFEFRWNTNAQFQDVASDLMHAVLQINSETGQSVHIVAHSFGGIVVRAALQQLSPFGDYRHLIASLTTLGTPHSGIVDTLATEYQSIQDVYFPDGQDSPYNLFESCGQVSCFQLGENVFFSDEAKQKLNLLRYDYATGSIVPQEAGEFAAALADFQKHPLYPEVPIQVLIGLTVDKFFPNYGEVEDGDALISFKGQRFHPKFSVAQTPPPVVANTGLVSDFKAYGPSITEHILGFDDTVQPGDSDPVPLGHEYYRFGYRHSGGIWISFLYGERGSHQEASVNCSSTDKCWHDGWVKTKRFVENNPAKDTGPLESTPISVTIVDSDGHGIPNVRIEIATYSIRVTPFVDNTTDENGQLQASMPKMYGDLSILAFPPEGSGFAAAESVRTGPPTDETGMIIFEPMTLVRSGDGPGPLTATILDETTDMPVPNSSYYLMRDNRYDLIHESGFTPDGLVSILDVPAGEYFFGAYANGYIGSADYACLVVSPFGNDCSIWMDRNSSPWQQVTATFSGVVSRVELQGTASIPDPVIAGDTVTGEIRYRTSDWYARWPREHSYWTSYSHSGSTELNDITVSIGGNTWTTSSRMIIVVIDPPTNGTVTYAGGNYVGPGDYLPRLTFQVRLGTTLQDDLTSSNRLPTSMSDFDFTVSYWPDSIPDKQPDCCIRLVIYARDDVPPNEEPENSLYIQAEIDRTTFTMTGEALP